LRSPHQHIFVGLALYLKIRNSKGGKRRELRPGKAAYVGKGNFAGDREERTTTDSEPCTHRYRHHRILDDSNNTGHGPADEASLGGNDDDGLVFHHWQRSMFCFVISRIHRQDRSRARLPRLWISETIMCTPDGPADLMRTAILLSVVRVTAIGTRSHL